MLLELYGLAAQQTETPRCIEVARSNDVVVTLDTRTFQDSTEGFYESSFLLTWALWKYVKPGKGSTDKQSRSSLYELKIDCKGKRFGIMRKTQYTVDGSVVSTFKAPYVHIMDRVEPESGEKTVESVCEYWAKRKKVK